MNDEDLIIEEAESKIDSLDDNSLSGSLYWRQVCKEAIVLARADQNKQVLEWLETLTNNEYGDSLGITGHFKEKFGVEE